MATSLTLSDTAAKKVAVISHERSGTHFLMNSIAANFDYISQPWWNFDVGEPVQFHSPADIEQYLRNADGKPVRNILKSHHPAGFFGQALEYFAAEFQLFYIYRDPRDALVSNWKLIRTLPWDEGPKPETASEFIRAEPSGAMLRYQKHQERNMLTRWRTHVEGWLDIAERRPECGICVLRYEELNLDFDQTVRNMAALLEREAENPVRPGKSQNVVGSGRGRVGTYREHLTDDDLAFIDAEIGATLDRLAYSR